MVCLRSGSVVAVLIALMCRPVAALPSAWVVAPAESRILFQYERSGNAAEGTFDRFSGEGSFDHKAPDEARLELRIESDSIALGDPLYDAFATSAEWFDSAHHPQIVFRLMQLNPEAAGRYQAEGEVTIRGRTRTISAPVTLEIGREAGVETARAKGNLRVDRKDYLLGVGPLSLLADVGREVVVRFELIAHPMP